MNTSRRIVLGLAAFAFALRIATPPARAQQVLEIGIGTQNTTTNTVTGGIIIKEMKLLEKHLPRTGKYANLQYKFDWQNFTSGPPITNGMMARRVMKTIATLAAFIEAEMARNVRK